ncbi:hypothetical protein [Shewanella sp.]|uniref:hypothetical protein n=1 Tax=Shewanella sp. TaxID=50422 RepID=UPI001EC251C2|nr:hypothetical protein [Shewanella sp.]NRB23642.1 hypothetical protein [Shewanella sp.]
MSVMLKISSLAIITFAGVLTMFTQTYVWPDAGKVKVDKSEIYIFQIDYWGEQIYEKFDRIRSSKNYSNLLRWKDATTIGPEFFKNIDEYHYQIKALLRVLKLHSAVAARMIHESVPMLPEIRLTGNKLITESILSDYQRFIELTKDFEARKEAIEKFLPSLRNALNVDTTLLTDNKKANLMVRHDNLLKEFYSSELLFMQHNSDHFVFVREFATESAKMLEHYELLNQQHNKRVIQQAHLKNLLLILIAVLAAVLTFKNELRAIKPTPPANKKALPIEDKNVAYNNT